MVDMASIQATEDEVKSASRMETEPQARRKDLAPPAQSISDNGTEDPRQAKSLFLTGQHSFEGNRWQSTIS
jgi:hypothetical protein